MMPPSFVCPFCPLHCDDLDAAKLLGDVPQRTARIESYCPLLARRLAPAIAHDATTGSASEPMIQRASGWIAQANSLLITGQVIDLETARAVCRFAQWSGAAVAMDNGCELAAADAAAYHATFTREGVFATTLGDAASPRNSIILIGDPALDWPRLRERLATAGEILRWERTDALAERLAWLRRSLRRGGEHPPQDDADIVRCRELCDRAQSIVFIVAPGSLGAAEALPFWSTLLGLLRDLNAHRRAALLRLDPALTLRSVTAWSGNRQAESPRCGPGTRADVVIELTSPRPSAPLPSCTAGEVPPEIQPLASGAGTAASKRITIGWAPAPGGEGAPATQTCHLPASSAGIGRAAVVLRGDGSVALPLRPLCATALPSPAEVLRQLCSWCPGA